ncbi:hypothetical protein COTS27_01687 [Spirochaetota bacterium]|nr:hypothetical protein COTS27_01687 [Spirochaetota bacterium]
MQKLSINLKNCYGINSLEYEFNFETKKVFSIYASNGTMKTSFAKTFLDLSEGQESKDEIYTERKTKRKIKIDEKDLQKEGLLVIKPYDESYKSDKINRLLVKPELKKKFDDQYKNIKKSKEGFITKIKKISGLNETDIEQEICAIFYQGVREKFFEALETREKEVLNDDETSHKNIKYSELFNDKTKDIVKNKDFINSIESYVTKYNELLERSNFFKKGIFNHIQATDIAAQLDKNGFFKAEHSISLKGTKDEIVNKKQLEKVIDDEKNKILKDKKLKEEFNKLDKILKKNQNLKNFREYLSNKPEIINEFKNVENLKAKLWIGYFKENKESFRNLLPIYNQSKKTIEEIKKQAKEEKNIWDKVITEFNEKFFVPFNLFVENQAAVILNDKTPSVSFKFNDKKVERDTLLRVLSQGEKRALYILNILFEINARKKSNRDCLFIIDDIADSFDYKNKYAIIDYLNEISKNERFYIIALTHNFDFHRSLSNRLDMGRKNKLNVLKSKDKIELIEEHYQNNPLTYWIDNLNNNKMLIASIPMARNLLEYLGKNEEKEQITKFLHIKTDTRKSTIKDLKCILKVIFGEEKVKEDQNQDNSSYYDLLKNESKGIQENDNSLESKIVLSIAIRLLAEDFMIKKTKADVSGIEKNQTNKLYETYKEECLQNNNTVKVLERVNLITPINIHLNSFMYEPILDMGIDELKQLYQDVEKLIKE